LVLAIPIVNAEEEKGEKETPGAEKERIDTARRSAAANCGTGHRCGTELLLAINHLEKSRHN
jgi:hypothetical protein